MPLTVSMHALQRPKTFYEHANWQRAQECFARTKQRRRHLIKQTFVYVLNFSSNFELFQQLSIIMILHRPLVLCKKNTDKRRWSFTCNESFTCSESFTCNESHIINSLKDRQNICTLQFQCMRSNMQVVSPPSGILRVKNKVHLIFHVDPRQDSKHSDKKHTYQIRLLPRPLALRNKHADKRRWSFTRSESFTCS